MVLYGKHRTIQMGRLSIARINFLCHFLNYFYDYHYTINMAFINLLSPAIEDCFLILLEVIKNPSEASLNNKGK